MWPAIHTRPNICYSVEVLSWYYANPTPLYYNLAIQVFCYLAEILDLGIIFRFNSTDELVGYIDSNWAGLKDGRKSTSRYNIFFLSGLVSQQSKQQAIVTLLLSEAKYITTTNARKKALWIACFLVAFKYR